MFARSMPYEPREKEHADDLSMTPPTRYIEAARGRKKLVIEAAAAVCAPAPSIIAGSAASDDRELNATPWRRCNARRNGRGHTATTDARGLHRDNADACTCRRRADVVEHGSGRGHAELRRERTASANTPMAPARAPRGRAPHRPRTAWRKRTIIVPASPATRVIARPSASEKIDQRRSAPAAAALMDSGNETTTHCRKVAASALRAATSV